MDLRFPQKYTFGPSNSNDLSIDHSTKAPSEKISIRDKASSNEASVVSDSESAVSGNLLNGVSFQEEEEEGTLGERDAVHDLIKRRFLEGCAVGTTAAAAAAEVVAIRRNGFRGAAGEARVRCFGVYERAVGRLRGGNANVKYAWYGTRGVEDVRDIVINGFGHRHGHDGNHRLCFSSDHSPLQSVKRCVADKDGVRHLLLCRVILGRSELVHPNCNEEEQCNPSSEDYDSGVDSFSDPKTYIIWSSRINTHVLPAFVISFRIPSVKVVEKSEERPLRPSSPWVPFPTLFSVLSKVLPPPEIALISMFHKEHKDKKISRHELIQKVRLIAGDKLLIAAIKFYRAKKNKQAF